MSVPAAVPAKAGIIAELGEHPLLLMARVRAALEANDRVKYYFTLLQAAREHADDPEAPVSVLTAERLAAGIPDRRLDDVPARSRRASPAAYFIPGAGGIHDDVVQAMRAMVAPLARDAEDGARLSARLDSVLASLPPISGDAVPATYIERVTSASLRSGDTLHQLVMDAHRALNRLQAALATENVDGAAVYAIDDADRGPIRAFMEGVHQTERLKLDHPGLGTTATRSGSRLLLQNDIGETGAHVVVFSIEALSVTVTYTDVHRERLHFFRRMLGDSTLEWTSARRDGGGEVGTFDMTTGSALFGDRSARDEFLRLAGSRLVFLIDWNRARKRLAAIAGKHDAVEILYWAAANGYGHVPFLAMGGERVVNDAVDASGTAPAHYGEPLVDVIGREATLDVLRSALRACSVGLLTGRSQSLIRDELRVELLRHARAAQAVLLEHTAEHASYIVEAAQALRDVLARQDVADHCAYAARSAARGGSWEHAADDLVSRMRTAAERQDTAQRVVDIISAADDAIDELEESLSLLTLVGELGWPALGPLRELAFVAVRSARGYFRAVDIARTLRFDAAGDDIEDFIEAVDDVLVAEHDADVSLRAARRAILSRAADVRMLYISAAVAECMERATDSLEHATLALRDTVLRGERVR